MEKQHLVMIGNGMAGLKTIEYLLKENNQLYDITIFGSEPYTNYSRIMLSSVLQGDVTFDDITINDWKWYEDNEITLYPNETVNKIDYQKQSITTDKERKLTYDRLIIATGSNPFIIPLPGVNKEGVMTFRTIDDCKQMIEVAKQHKKAAVIGGGLLGLEAARGLLNLGMEVDVIHLADRLLNNQLDVKASHLLKKELEQLGMNFYLEKETSEIYGDKNVEGLHFKDGTSIEADLVVMAVGIKPNVALAKESGIEVSRGIVVNDQMETSISNVYAVGECTEHNGTVYGLVKPLYEQAEVLGQSLANQKARYLGSTVYTQLKISGIDLFSVGKIEETNQTKTIYSYDEIGETYKKVLFEEDKAVGAVLYGDTSLGGSLLDMIKKQKFIPDHQKAELLQPVKIEESYAATLPRNEHVCTCNSVSKSCIIENVLNKNLNSVNDVKTHTKASSSCGGCKPVVQELLDYIQSDYFHETVKDNRFCSCTSLTEDEVVRAIQQHKLTSIEMIIEALEWNHSSGCSKCRPALAYYLEMIYPEHFVHEEFLFLDHKTNAVAEKDGTYTIVPQLYSGKVSAEQLKHISGVLIDYDIDTVSISSDQRLKINGIQESDLISVCSALNMTLHSYHPSSLRSVQIPECNCIRDKEELSTIVEQIEQQTEFVNLPTSLTIKAFCCKKMLSEHYFDLALLQTGSGWELITDQGILYATISSPEMINVLLSFIQYYRRSANYNEKISQWTERVGIVHIREVLFNQDIQQMLLDDLKSDQTSRKQLMVRHLQL
ncbi:nitrite reductase (NADH) large subunit [Gracilibacillus orientalis]|uniref:Nitrite reductase (NADH) large subunit n=1 Tax=Gracilibacillus orientalis TaxID=334253 RepID=A0A1I4MG67_9BACI|nr:nitrite reductase large subunit NirB [Gracilibacillus orientalis]SFM02241.1 nitrite reductase (NADH) large subunit [Gracilibacillus orientalis]